jgi:hypothetical protein
MNILLPFLGVKEEAKKVTSQEAVSCLTYTLAAKMEAVHSSKMSVNFSQTTWLHIPADNTFHSHCHGNVTSSQLLDSMDSTVMKLLITEVNWFIKKFAAFINLKIHRQTHKSSSLDPILSQLNLIHFFYDI